MLGDSFFLGGVPSPTALPPPKTYPTYPKDLEIKRAFSVIKSATD